MFSHAAAHLSSTYLSVVFKRFIYTLRQKFSIVICVKGCNNIWLELIQVNKYFDTIVPIRCQGYGANNQDLYGFKIDCQLDTQ